MSDNIIIHKSEEPITLKVNQREFTFTKVELMTDKSTYTEATVVFGNNGEYQVINMPWNEFFYLRNKIDVR